MVTRLCKDCISIQSVVKELPSIFGHLQRLRLALISMLILHVPVILDRKLVRRACTTLAAWRGGGHLSAEPAAGWGYCHNNDWSSSQDVCPVTFPSRTIRSELVL